MQTASPPLIIGHRGAPTEAPENTLASFARAIAEGVDALECDVRLTADEAIVIIHDATVDATTNGHGAVAQLTLAQIQQLAAHSRATTRKPSETTPEHEHIPTLTEFLDRFGSLGIMLNIEIKPNEAPSLTDAVAQAITDQGLTTHVLFSSFDQKVLAQLQRHHPATRRAMLFPPTMLAGLQAGLLRQHRWLLTAQALGCEAVHPFWQLANHRTVDLAHQNGLHVNAWTVDDVATATKLVAVGADGIITNVAAQMRRHFPQRQTTPSA